MEYHLLTWDTPFSPQVAFGHGVLSHSSRNPDENKHYSISIAGWETRTSAVQSPLPEASNTGRAAPGYRIAECSRWDTSPVTIWQAIIVPAVAISTGATQGNVATRYHLLLSFLKLVCQQMCQLPSQSAFSALHRVAVFDGWEKERTEGEKEEAG